MKTIKFEEKKDVCSTTIKEYERMCSLGLLKEDSYFCKENVEFVLDYKYVPEDWKFISKFIRLKNLIEYHGFYITQVGLTPPEFRILKTKEMIEHGMKQLKKSAHLNFKTHHIMTTHNSSKLDDRDKKLYDSVVNKSASIALYQQKMLIEDFNL